MLVRCNKSVKLRIHDDWRMHATCRMAAGNVKKSKHYDVLMYVWIFQDYIKTCRTSISSVLQTVSCNDFLPPVLPIWPCQLPLPAVVMHLP